jgi:transcriptional regulator with AAA-type ATPase domain
MSELLPILLLRARLGGQERRFRLAPGVHLVGSGEAADVRLRDPTISRQHLRLEAGDGVVWLADLGSRNGSWVDGRRLDGEAREWALPLLLRVGEIELQIDALDAADARLAVAGDVEPSPQPSSLSASPVTLAEGGLGRFARVALPRLLDALETPGAPEQFAIALAVQLQQQFESLSLRVRLDDALVASAGASQGGAQRSWTSARWSLLVDGPAELLEANARVFELALRLLVLSARSGAVSTSTPSPFSVVAADVPAPGSSNPALRALYAQSAQLARSELAVLVLGETGTGKELFARHLHQAAGLPDARWVALNCAALPEDQLEAELFGIDRGVATGVSERVGCFEQADGGTLFLDEIGDMSLTTQAKILRVLQERQFYRVGSRKPRPARVRVVSATNAALEAMVEAGRFRLDLYHRLADWVVTLPALRERREDVANLAAHFLGREMRRLGKRFGGLSDACVDALRRYRWPGNVRELEREMLRCALVLGDGEPLCATQLQRRFENDPTGPSPETLKQILEDAERKAIVDALAGADGNVELAAERLDCGKSTMYRRIKQLGIEG